MSELLERLRYGAEQLGLYLPAIIGALVLLFAGYLVARQVVEVLVRNPGRLVTQRQLLQEVWGPQYEKETNYLRVYLAQIRKKLEPDPRHPRYFVTEPGIGYRLENIHEPS